MSKSVWERMIEVDRRVIYLLVFILIMWPLLQPMGLPVPITAITRKVYDAVEAVPDGGMILFSANHGFASLPENGPQLWALMQHVFDLQARKPGIRIIFHGFWIEGTMVADTYLKKLGKGPDDPNYGKTYVNLGWIPLAEVGMATWATDIHRTTAKDMYGIDTGTIPLMKDLKTLTDIMDKYPHVLLITVESGTPGIPEFLRQWQEPYKVKNIVTACTAVVTPGNMPYVAAGQLIGVVDGLSGAAQYEVLIRRPGEASAGTDALSMTHFLVIVFVVIGNIGYFEMKRRRAS